LYGVACTAVLAMAGCQADKAEPTNPVKETSAQKVENQISVTANPIKLLWGDTHLHTLNSADAFSFGARLSPADAYKFARGDVVTSNSGQKPN